MTHRVFFGSVLSAMTLCLGAQRADAQAMLADDIMTWSKGQREQERARTNTHPGLIARSGEKHPFRVTPGAGEARLGEQPGGPGFISTRCNNATCSRPQVPTGEASAK